jgi:hypothetical protein
MASRREREGGGGGCFANVFIDFSLQMGELWLWTIEGAVRWIIDGDCEKRWYEHRMKRTQLEYRQKVSTL